jgi:hypothetical protein
MGGKCLLLTVGIFVAVFAVAGKPALAPLQPHPRLFASNADFAAQKVRLSSAPEGRVALERLLKRADEMLELKPLERQMEGMRLLHISNAAVDRIGRLAFAWKMTSERKYADRAIEEALAVSRFSDWNPDHFLDVGEMTLAVALAIDWLDEVLSEADRKTLSEAVLLKGLTNGDGKTLPTGWWCRTECNWNQVCHGGLAAGAAAVRDDYPEVAEAVLRRARECLPVAMASYAGGSFPEGIGYWRYATEFSAIALDTLGRQFADGVPELFASPGFAQQIDYVNMMTGPTGYQFNYSDPFVKPLNPTRPQSACWYLALRFNRFDALNPIERELLLQGYDSGRLTPLLLLWFRPQSETSAAGKATLCRKLGGDCEVAVLRSGFGFDSWYVGIKAGSASLNHAHMDAGSFVLDVSGARWACELGCEPYNRIEQMKTIKLWNFSQDSSRWSLFRLNTDGHGTLQIDGAQQAVNGFARIVSFTEGPNAEAVVDLSEVYTNATKVTRTFRLAGDALTVVDRLEGLKPGAHVSWNMNTLAEVDLDGSKLNLAMKNRRGKNVGLTMRSLAGDAAWQAESIAQPRTPADSPNPGVVRLRLSQNAPEDGRLEFAVRFEKHRQGVKQ